MSSWRPGRRAASRALETPFEGVPDHLFGPLWSWLFGYLRSNDYLITAVGIEFRMAMPAPETNRALALKQVATRARDDPGFMLDLVEYVLERVCGAAVWDADWEGAEELEETLLAGNSAYKVRADRNGLEMRTTPEVQHQVQEVVTAATGSAGAHLAEAWNKAYSRQPDPVKSYSESIKAVEAAMAVHISPKNTKQTLGTMIRDVAAKPDKWKFVIPGGNANSIETVLHMMRTLWNGQSSRHGGLGPTRSETIDEAQAAVHLASALVQFGVSGAFSPA